MDHRGHRSHASTSSFSEFQSGLSQSSSSSSLGPIRTRHSSNASGSYGRGGPLVPSTPPRHAGSSQPFSPEDTGSRRRVDSRSRQAQALKGSSSLRHRADYRWTVKGLLPTCNRIAKTRRPPPCLFLFWLAFDPVLAHFDLVRSGTHAPTRICPFTAYFRGEYAA